MGHGISAKDIVPFGGVIFEFDTIPPHEELNLLIDPANHFCCEAEESEDEHFQNKWTEFTSLPEDDLSSHFEEWLGTQSYECNGWTYGGVATIGKKEMVRGHKWTKDDYNVILVNTSQYENIGVVEGTLCANDEISATEFIKDFARKLSSVKLPEENHIVIQWS